jgi:hypothetical protein
MRFDTRGEFLYCERVTKEISPVFAVRRNLASMVLIMSISAACAPYHTTGGVSVSGGHGSVVVAFSNHDITEIRDYYRAHLPPGLAKKGKLPPGLQKQLAKNGQLPPGLQRDPLPAELEARLSPLPEGYIRVRIGTDVVLFNQRTHIVIDIIKEIGL